MTETDLKKATKNKTKTGYKVDPGVLYHRLKQRGFFFN